MRYLPKNDPIQDVRKELQEIWLVAPDAYRMGSSLSGEISAAPSPAAGSL